MSDSKILVREGDYRAVRSAAGYVTIEHIDGYDALGNPRWTQASSHGNFRGACESFAKAYARDCIPMEVAPKKATP